MRLDITPDQLPGILNGAMARVWCQACGVHPGAVRVFRHKKYGINALCAICTANYLYATKKP